MAKRSNNGAIKQRAYNKDYLMLGCIPSETLPIKPICFLCGEMLSNESMKPSKLMRHQHTKHAATISNDSSFFLRKKELYLSNQSANIVNLFTKKAKDVDNAVMLSFNVSLAIAKAKKPHTIAEELIKPCCIDIVGTMFSDSAAQKIKSIPLSNDTVKRRIDVMAVDCENQLIQEVRNSPYFAIQLDESTTVASEALLLVFVRYLNTNDNSLRSDLLHYVNLSTTTRGEDIFGQILDFFHHHELDFQKLVGCCSDGAASMMGVHKGFVARMKPISPNCKFIHCFLHRQALAAKKLSPILNEVLSVCIKLVNFIKSRPLNNRIFSELCIDEEHKTLLLHTEVRWLLRGRVLGRLFELQNPVREFLKTMMLISICGILKAVIVIF